MSVHCRKCNRLLKNPLSVKLGIGPICRAKQDLQGEFDFMRAQFDVVKHERGKYIYIRDVGHNCRSVTNDAEYVIEQLYLEWGITDETRIFYEDTDGAIDEIEHIKHKFICFKPGHEGVDL